MQVSALIVIYTCGLCDLVDEKVAVRLRGEHEDIAEWMRSVQVLIADDHWSKRPDCHPDTLKEVKIPLGQNTKRIGEAYE